MDLNSSVECFFLVICPFSVQSTEFVLQLLKLKILHRKMKREEQREGGRDR